MNNLSKFNAQPLFIDANNMTKLEGIFETKMINIFLFNLYL